MNSNIDFIPGLELARRFYWEAVRPVLDADFPGLRHSAALIGTGSEVLGFDTPMSSDHHWGPHAMLFLAEDDCERHVRSRVIASPRRSAGSCPTASWAIRPISARRTRTTRASRSSPRPRPAR